MLSANELKTIEEVLNRLSEMNATQISEYSHGDVPWLTTEDGAKIEYEAVSTEPHLTLSGKPVESLQKGF